MLLVWPCGLRRQRRHLSRFAATMSKRKREISWTIRCKDQQCGSIPWTDEYVKDGTWGYLCDEVTRVLSFPEGSFNEKIDSLHAPGLELDEASHREYVRVCSEGPTALFRCRVANRSDRQSERALPSLPPALRAQVCRFTHLVGRSDSCAKTRYPKLYSSHARARARALKGARPCVAFDHAPMAQKACTCAQTCWFLCVAGVTKPKRKPISPSCGTVDKDLPVFTVPPDTIGRASCFVTTRIPFDDTEKTKHG